MPEPTDQDWRRLGPEPRPTAVRDREYAYGVWRTLSWPLGVRQDWPTHTGWHIAAGIPPECPHHAVPMAERDTDAWRAADHAARQGAQAEALRNWRHIRQAADATADRR